MEKFYEETFVDEVQSTETDELGVELTDTTETEEIDVHEEKVAEEVKMISLEEAEALAIKRANDAVEARLKRERKQFEKELAKYKSTETILRAGLGTETIDEANEKLETFYKQQGVVIPENKGLSEREIEILARAEAEEIIEAGFEEMAKEANELAKRGYENLDAREKKIFTTLAEKLTQETQKQELIKIGVEPSVLEEREFKEFASKFNSKTPIADIYNLYSKTNKPKKQIEKMGSMKSLESPTKIKEFYTMEEVAALTEKDLDNPELLRAVEDSMTKW
jgi:hypothetical protein